MNANQDGTALAWKSASSADLKLLAAMNRELIEDEGSANPMTDAELEARMSGWLDSSEWTALLLCMGDGDAAGYALYRRQDDGDVYLRQYLIRRPYRRAGFGLAGIALLRERLGPACRLTIDVLAGNARGIAFWEKAGFAAYSVHMKSSVQATD
ncbi:GNAT family N-acetyltransferase [Cohnella sp. 56]|uniref:GNAT family N-acetyltransferase n=1 Tax=Cohnella sp. 56 TaxID=3113722 RepID=UPI0030E974A8